MFMGQPDARSVSGTVGKYVYVLQVWCYPMHIATDVTKVG